MTPQFISPDHPFVKALRDLDLDRVREYLTEDPSLTGKMVRGDYSLTGMDWKEPVDEDFPGYMGPLHFAAFYGHLELAKLLIEFGAGLNDPGMDFRNNDGPTTAASLAAWEGGIDVLRVLLNAGRDANVKMDLVDALDTAASHRSSARVKLLLEHGATHNIYTASMVGDLEMVKLRLEEDPALANRKDPRWGRTALSSALNAPSPLEIVTLLLKAGADPDLANKEGKRPVEIARERELHEVVKLFEEKSP